MLRTSRQKPERGGLRIVAYGLDDLWQADLVDLHDGHFALVRTDVVSKRSDVVWLRNKSGQRVLEGFKLLQKRNGGNLPLRIQTDKGKEFLNSSVLNFFKENNVTHFTGEGDKKAAVVESFNRTWQRKYHKYKLETNFKIRNKQKIFDLVVKNYNLTPHTALSGRSPSEITRDAASELVSKQLTEREELRKKYSSSWRQVGDKRRQKKKIGDYERRCETSKNQNKLGDERRRCETSAHFKEKLRDERRRCETPETVRDTGDSCETHFKRETRFAFPVHVHLFINRTRVILHRKFLSSTKRRDESHRQTSFAIVSRT